MPHQCASFASLICLGLLVDFGCALRESAQSELQREASASNFPDGLGPLFFFDAGFPELELSTGEQKPGKWLLAANSSSYGGTWKTGDASGKLSAEKHGALPGMEAAFGIEQGSIHRVAWAYPDPAYADKPAHPDGQTQQSLFKKFGGFVYFNDCNQIVAVKGVARQEQLLKFGAPEECPSCKLDECPGESGFTDYHAVTIDMLLPHVSHYCWLPPATCARANPKHHDGCFAYKKKNAAGFLIFPVAMEQEPGDFPNALGPFLLASARDNVKTLSQWSPLTMPASTRTELGVPSDASTQMWAYHTENKHLEGLTHGGFVFNRDHGETNKCESDLGVGAVGSMGGKEMKIVPVEYKLTFSEPSAESFTAEPCKPWHDISVKDLYPGAKRFCWSGDGGGSFVFEMQDGSVVSFPFESRQLSAP